MKHIQIKPILFILFCFLFSFGMEAKDLYLKGHVKGFTGKQVMLAFITNLRMNPVDTAVAENGKFVFNISSRKAGAYSIIFDYGIYADIIINNENIEFTSVLTESNNVEDSIRFITSEENRIYYEYQRYKQQADRRAAYEKHIGNKLFSENATGNAAKLDSLRILIETIQKSISDKAYELCKKHPDLFVAKKLKFYLLPDFYDFKKLHPDTKYNNDFEFLQEHYFDNVDIKDTNLLDVAYLNNISLSYLTNYTVPQNRENFIKSCDFILEHVKGNSEAFCSVLEVIVRQMENWDQDSAYIYLANNYYSKGFCDDAPAKKAVINAASIMQQFSKGNPFPDIVLNDTSGIARRLYASSGKLTLVFFWLSTCEHCERMLPDIKKIYTGYKNQGFDVYAVSMDEFREQWVNAVKTQNLQWINVSELKGFQGDVARQFNISKTPRMYLIAQDKKIIARPLNPEQLRKQIGKYFKSTE